jgi:hypothetical protein
MEMSRWVIAEFDGSMPVAFVQDCGVWGLKFVRELEKAISFPTMKSGLKFVKMHELELGHCIVTQAKGCLK